MLVKSLDKASFIPLYFQIQQDLAHKIDSGALKEGEALPSEEELSRVHRVSRMTARQALQGLKHNGYAYSERGRGTFVRRPKLEKNMLHLQGFTEEIREQGRKPSSHVLERDIHKADAELQEKLHIQSTDEVLSLLRVRLADEQPVALDHSLLPLIRMPELRHVDFASQSIYGSMRQLHGIRLAWADETIEAIAASSEEAEILQIKRGSPILSIRRIVYSANKVPIEVAWTRYPGAKYRASIHLPMMPTH